MDETSPNVNIISPTNTTYTVNVTTLNFTATDNTALSYCWYSIDNGITNSTLNDCTSNFSNINDSVEGQNNWTIYVNDTSGNLNQTNISFSIDTIAPIVTVVLPVDGNTYTTSTVTLQVTTNENSTCEYSLDSGITNSSMSANTNGTIHEATTTSLANSNYLVNYYCSDLVGNENLTANSSFIVNVVSTPSSSGGSSGGGGGGSITETPKIVEDSKIVISTSEIKKTLSLNRIELGQIEIENKDNVQKKLTFEVQTISSILDIGLLRQKKQEFI